jgi:predicted GNAT superfamily acetyltransferase
MIVYRPCQGFDELEACVQMQVETWGYDAGDVIPRKAYRVAQQIGGQVMGAFDTVLESASDGGNASSMVGFLMALPGVKSENGVATPYLHSHMLAVREAYRNRGLGVELKRRQRVDALDRGIQLIEWTFDPLEIKNAYLNFCKLGVLVCRYYEDFYGVSSSRLQGGLPTDRLVAEWRLESPRVRAVLAGQPAAASRIEERISVPASIYQWKASSADRERALEVQLRNRRMFQKAFAQGLAVIGFLRDANGNGIFELGQPAQAELATYTKGNDNL